MPEKITITLNEHSLVAVLPLWVTNNWQREAKSLFRGFDQDGVSAIETNVEDSEIPESECKQMIEACELYGMKEIGEAIHWGVMQRHVEEFDAIAAYKATINQEQTT